MNTPQGLIGRKLQDRFLIMDLLGNGSMGIVYRGFDEATLDEVAIKVLHPSLAEHEELVARFHREAAAARRVDHESTVRVLGRGYEEGVHYMVMELLHGRSLASVLDEAKRLPEGRAARIVVQLCGVLAVAHERGVVHRDIKPDNIMVVEGVDQTGERVKLLDFGIAKRLSPASRRPGAVEDSFSTGEDTGFGVLIGTPDYMSPEQCMGHKVDGRTDVYACGVLLYRMVTGQVPFDGSAANALELCERHISEPPVPPRKLAPWIAPAMEAVILKALSKAPEARQQTAVELRDELSQILSAIERVEMEPTAPVSIQELVSPEDAAVLAAGLAAPAPAYLADTILDGDSVPAPVPIPVPIRAIAPTVIPVPPVKLIGLPDPQGAPITRRDPRGDQRGRLSAYLPTVALAAVIGAGLGSLFMALAPLLQH
jgi:serine/threonine-protein kinase